METGVFLISESVSVSGSAYASITTGEYDYAFKYNSYPVYQFPSGGYTFSIYRRSNGYWYLDFNDVSEDYAGSIDYSLQVASNPWEVTWKSGVIDIV